MPLIERSSYTRPPFYQFNGHLQTVLPAILRRVETPYERERLTLPDGDFLDLDWIDRGSRRLVILTHGLEGNSDRHYMKGMANLFAEQYPGAIDASKLDEVREWRDFDNFFSAPLNGYEDAADFYRRASAQNYMAGTDRPILLVNAVNDPILPPECSPVALCEQHDKIFLEMPQKGGHVGFTLPKAGYAWSEYRALEWCGG
ncbi:MAG: hypothetical protein KDC75_14245 [Phaeodactylibacter sp.]|nr:hypothetical protein [Phaeodactylibacter sp.]